MADDISIAISADISGIEAGMADALASVNATLADITQAFDKANTSIGHAQFSPISQKSADTAERAAERIVEIGKQTNEKLIAGAEQLNAFQLKMGKETAEQFTAQELTLAK